MGVGAQASNRVFIVVRKSKRNPLPDRVSGVDGEERKRLGTELAPETLSADP